MMPCSQIDAILQCYAICLQCCFGCSLLRVKSSSLSVCEVTAWISFSRFSGMFLVIKHVSKYYKSLLGVTYSIFFSYMYMYMYLTSGERNVGQHCSSIVLCNSQIKMFRIVYCKQHKPAKIEKNFDLSVWTFQKCCSHITGEEDDTMQIPREVECFACTSKGHILHISISRRERDSAEMSENLQSHKRHRCRAHEARREGGQLHPQFYGR